MLAKGTPLQRIASRSVLKVGAATIAVGVALDVPPHLVPHASLETLALVGHLVVLGGMAIVLLGLIAVAITVPRSEPEVPLTDAIAGTGTSGESEPDVPLTDAIAGTGTSGESNARRPS